MYFSMRSLIVGCCLSALPATGFSATYICVQADGRKAYTDNKAEAEARGCNEIVIRPNDGSQRASPRKGSAVTEPPRRVVAKPPPLRIQPIEWDAPPINFVSGKSDNAVSPDDLYIALSKSVYELTSRATESKGIAYGSAVAVTTRHALTNCHVVRSSTNVLVLIQGDGRKLPARLVGAQPFMDKCVVESTSTDLVPIGGIRSFASLREGERLYAIGNPQGLKGTISDGLLSGKRAVKGVRVVQTTAPISPGSSGGGLFDSAGNLIGITTASLEESQNINIAIPAEDYWAKSGVRRSQSSSDERICSGTAGTADERISACTRAITSGSLSTATLAMTFVNRGVTWWNKRDYDRAIADYNEAIRLDPKIPMAYNSLAWLLATAHRNAVRNGARAIELARKACELTAWKDARFIDTLAAAYAEVGQFVEAVRWQEKALGFPAFVKSKFGEGAQKRLALYRAGKPYRE